jgi:hypothetical protein
MRTIVDALEVARSNLVAQASGAAIRRRPGRWPQPEAGLLQQAQPQRCVGNANCFSSLQRNCCGLTPYRMRPTKGS